MLTFVTVRFCVFSVFLICVVLLLLFTIMLVLFSSTSFQSILNELIIFFLIKTLKKTSIDVFN